MRLTYKFELPQKALIKIAIRKIQPKKSDNNYLYPLHQTIFLKKKMGMPPIPSLLNI
jgi:hypothetical protein